MSSLLESLISIFRRKKFAAKTVFVAGGLPIHTYVKRSEYKLEARLYEAQDQLCKLVTVTGSTKSGKTVLTRKVYPRSHAIWLDGGSFDSVDDIWQEIVSQLEGVTDSEKTTGVKKSYSIRAKLANLFREGNAEVAPGYSVDRSESVKVRRKRPTKTTAIEALRRSKLPLVIDDFHYLDRDAQTVMVRALKPVVFDGQPVIFIAIPHRRYDAVKVEREMTGRIEPIHIPAWTPQELAEIPKLGFSLLNVEMSETSIGMLGAEALGSPHLMQEFCRELCSTYSIFETLGSKLVLECGRTEVENVFKKVAIGTSKIIFDRLAQGPRQRSDRKRRNLVGGSTADIYAVVLRAIAKLRPGVTTLDYESIRSALREILDEPPPQRHEVSRVLEQMARISADDEASVPVIDWQKQEGLLHITDPFFAFFLKWGVLDEE